MRWVLSAPETALPSENNRSYQAMLALQGSRNNWWSAELIPQISPDFNAAQKLEYLVTAHADCSHLGGRDGIYHAVREVLCDMLWKLAKLDAQFVSTRCEHCRLQSTRGMGDAELRHLPRPETSGEILGWDLKKMVPAAGDPWMMVLGVCFCTNKAFAWDKAKLQDIQQRILRYTQDHDLMAANWSDNGGPFRNTI